MEAEANSLCQAGLYEFNSERQYLGGILYKTFADHFRRGGTEGSQASWAAFRNSHYRKVLEVGKLCGRGSGWNVSDRSFRPPCGRCHQGPLGQQGQFQHRQWAEPEDLREHRRMEKQSSGEHVPLYVCGWDMAQAVMRRRCPVSIDPCRYRSNKEGYYKVLSVAEGSREDTESWRCFFHIWNNVDSNASGL